MQESTNFGLKLFDGADPFSRLVFNQNWNLLDEVIKTQRDEVDSALKERAEEVDGVLAEHQDEINQIKDTKSNILVGSYVGTEPVATDKFYDAGSEGGYGTQSSFTNQLGFAKSSANDVVLAEVDFEPSLIMVSAYAEYPYTYTGVEAITDGTQLYKTTRTISGKETRSFAMVSARNSAVVPYVFEQVGPSFSRLGMNSSSAQFIFVDKKPLNGSGNEMQYYNLPWIIGKAFVQVTPVNGKWRVAIKGANQEYNTENFANIAGMTYNWMILGK